MPHGGNGRSALGLHRLWEAGVCNRRNCPQCGRADTARWVATQLDRRLGAPYFMVTFTLPAALRPLFHSPARKEMYDLFFRAASQALQRCLARRKCLGVQKGAYSLLLHTWNQRLLFHPHLHAIVAGAGLDAAGRVRQVARANFLVHHKVLRRAFLTAFRREWQALDPQLRAKLPEIHPGIWNLSWGVHLQPFGDGRNIMAYLGAYVCRTAIGDSRLVSMTDTHVTFTWKDRAHGNAIRRETLPGEEFIRRYLLHVLPQGLKAIRHYGLNHPSAKAQREEVAFHTGCPLVVLPEPVFQPETGMRCPCCQGPMRKVGRLQARWRQGRAPQEERQIL